MLAPALPDSVDRDLKAYDASLRLRWGPHTSLWYLEKKLDVRHPSLGKERPNPLGTSPRCRDLWEGYRDGYAIVMCVHPSLCTSRIILEALRNTDLHALGGAEALNRRLDAIQEAEDKAQDRVLDTFLQGASRDLFDRAQWMGKRRIQVPNDDVDVARITPVEQHDGFSVLDRRVRV